MTSRRYHFTLTEAQAGALLDVVTALDSANCLHRGSTLDRAANALDEQMSQQNAPWEKCKPCGGSGWIEGGD